MKDAFGVKVNDVVLALTSAAVRRYLTGHRALPAEPLVGMCPVSVRAEDERGRPDNQVSAMFVHLRTDLDDPAARLRAIARTTRGAKEDHNAVGARLLQNWAEHAAPATFALATRLYSRLDIADRHPPIYNLVVSNVPGPDFPLYLDGAELVATYPMGPVMEGAGLNVTVLSYRDNVDFGFLAAAELVPDVWDLADHIEEAMAELLAAAAAETAGRDEPSPEAAQANGAARRPKADKAAPPKAPAARTAKTAKAAKRRRREGSGEEAEGGRPGAEGEGEGRQGSSDRTDPVPEAIGVVPCSRGDSGRPPTPMTSCSVERSFDVASSVVQRAAGNVGAEVSVRITAKVDYAVRAVIEMAAAPAGPVKGEVLATRQSIPPKFLENILADLRRAGIVASQRGADGGYWLAVPADKVTVADVIRAVEGPLADVHGTSPEQVTLPGSRRRPPPGVGRHPGRPAGRSRGGDGRRHRRRRPAAGRRGDARRPRRMVPPLTEGDDGWRRDIRHSPATAAGRRRPGGLR